MSRVRKAASVIAAGTGLIAGFAALVGTEQTALAKDCTQSVLSTCINSDTFWPSPGPTRFVYTGGTETVTSGQVAFGLVTSYQSRPMVLRIASPGNGTDQYAVDNQVNGTFLWGYGMTDRLELDLAVPVTFYQNGSGLSPITGGRALLDTGLRDLRFGLAYAVVQRPRVDLETQAKDKDVFGVTTRLAVSAPTGDTTQFGGERGAVFVPTVAADYRRGRWFAGLELGARVRQTSELVGARVGTQLSAALGVGADVLPRELLSVSAEARALPTLVEQADATQSAFGITSKLNGKHITPAEWSVGVRSAPFLAGDVSFLLAGGGPIPIGESAITTPRFRFTFGIVYAPLGRDSDHDGVLDKNDKCPNAAASPNSYPPRDGCQHDSPPADAAPSGPVDVSAPVTAPGAPPPAAPPAAAPPPGGAK